MVKSKRAKTAATQAMAKSTSPVKKSDEKILKPDSAPVEPTPQSPPPQRKRRMASLNAEFFVRYSSSFYKNQTPTKTTKKTNQTELNESNVSDSKKRKRTAASPASAPSIVSTSESNPKTKLNNSKVMPKSAKATAKPKQVIKSPKKVLPKTSTETTPKGTTKKQKAVKSKEKLNATCPIELITADRPRRDASARASAMIIQTSEFEKARHFSTKKEEEQQVGKDLTIGVTKQVEGGGNEKEVYKSVSPLAHKKEPIKKTVSAAAQDAEDAVENSTVTSKPIRVKALKKASKVPKKALVKKTKLDTSESTKAKSQTKSPSNASEQPTVEKKILAGDKLTEDIIKEHNIINGSLSRGNGSSFSNGTKMYIVKWAMENVPSVEKPFEAKIIPIESFGEKILDQPQYLKNKKAKPPNAVKQQVAPLLDQDRKGLDANEKSRPIASDTEAMKTNSKDLKETGKSSTKPKSNSNSEQQISQTKIAPENTTTYNKTKELHNNTKSERSSSMSESVHLVVDETPAETSVEPPAITTCSPNNNNNNKSQISHSDESNKKSSQPAAILVAAIPSSITSVLNIKQPGDNKAENSENLSTKADKAATELAKEISPIKPKSVLNIVTDNIEPVQVLNDIKANVLSELMNESSNTNYSMED